MLQQQQQQHQDDGSRESAMEKLQRIQNVAPQATQSPLAMKKRIVITCGEVSRWLDVPDEYLDYSALSAEPKSYFEGFRHMVKCRIADLIELQSASAAKARHVKLDLNEEDNNNVVAQIEGGKLFVKCDQNYIELDSAAHIFDALQYHYFVYVSDYKELELYRMKERGFFLLHDQSASANKSIYAAGFAKEQMLCTPGDSNANHQVEEADQESLSASQTRASSADSQELKQGPDSINEPNKPQQQQYVAPTTIDIRQASNDPNTTAQNRQTTIDEPVARNLRTADRQLSNKASYDSNHNMYQQSRSEAIDESMNSSAPNYPYGAANQAQAQQYFNAMSPQAGGNMHQQSQQPISQQSVPKEPTSSQFVVPPPTKEELIQDSGNMLPRSNVNTQSQPLFASSVNQSSHQADKSQHTYHVPNSRDSHSNPQKMLPNLSDLTPPSQFRSEMNAVLSNNTPAYAMPPPNVEYGNYQQQQQPKMQNFQNMQYNAQQQQQQQQPPLGSSIYSNNEVMSSLTSQMMPPSANSLPPNFQYSTMNANATNQSSQSPYNNSMPQTSGFNYFQN
ncbi:MAG: hypothetical protein MHMPM18_001660 [Marteilia pararefringens]